MAQAVRKTDHPYIISDQEYCGGSPVVKGTKFPVRSIINYVLRQGLTPEELVKEFPHLTLAQVHDALSYYYDHQQAIERELDELTEDKLRAEKTG